MLCSEALVVKRTGLQVAARILYCRSWQCEMCRPQRSKQLVAQAIRGKANKFLTLTVSAASGPNPIARCKALIGAWRKMRRALEEQFDIPRIEFMAVVEAQKSGEPHLHILMRSPYIEQRWISEFMAVEIGAPICWIEEVGDKKKLANYVAKYCGKDPHRFGTCKRYWQSRGWDLDPKSLQDEAPIMDEIKSVVETDLDTWATGQIALGATLTFEGKWVVARFAPLTDRELSAIRQRQIEIELSG